MRIAHLILAHTDPVFISRLAKRLSGFSDVYIHIDKKTEQDDFIEGTKRLENCYYVKNRYKVFWGGMNVVNAELELIKEARNHQHYDRYVLLHGADYPLKSDEEIVGFFNKNYEVEFIRGCCISESSDHYFSDKCKRVWLMDCPSRVIKYTLANIPIRLRSGYINNDSNEYKVYFGSALWAITDSCVEYILEFSKDKKFVRWFQLSYAPDELFFHTIIMNSKYSKRTLYGGPEPEKCGLVNWRNLHYFEYPNKTSVWEKEDYEFLLSRPELYIRKVNSSQSLGLLDILDGLNESRRRK